MRQLLLKIVSIIRSEGLPGIWLRANDRLLYLRKNLNRILKRRVVKSAYGIKLKANYDDSTFKFYVEGTYGHFYSSLLQNFDRDFHFIDVGANQGLYSILAAKNTRCQSVFAFEPVHSTAEICEENFALNRVADKIKLIRKAIDTRNGIAEISISANHSGKATISRQDSQIFDDSENITVVNHEGLDELVQVDDLPILVKIDVEGHEDIVLGELFQTKICHQIQQVFYECNETWIEADAIRRSLERRGFELKKVGAHPIHYDVLATRESLPANRNRGIS